jgi:hypothetical protein
MPPKKTLNRLIKMYCLFGGGYFPSPLNFMWVVTPSNIFLHDAKIFDKKDIVLYSHLAYKSERFFELI